MIGWFLRLIGVHDERPEPAVVCAKSTSEQQFDQTARAVEQSLKRSNQYLISWEDLYDPARRRR